MERDGVYNLSAAVTIATPSYRCPKHGDVGGSNITISIPNSPNAGVFCLHCYAEMIAASCCRLEKMDNEEGE